MAATSKNKIHLESRFPAVKKGMWDAVQNARDRALDEGEAEAEKRLERVNDQRGYNLPPEIEQEKTGNQSGLIRYGDWFGKFFEYGTIYIAPRRSCDPPTGRCGSGSWMRWAATWRSSFAAR